MSPLSTSKWASASLDYGLPAATKPKRSTNSAGRRAGSIAKDNSWNINTTDVRNDFTDGKARPKWILSTYGAGKNPPASLLEGNEYSPEEVRMRFYDAEAQSRETEADQEAIALWTNCQTAMNNILNSVDEIIPFMQQAEGKHPNRYDLVKMDGSQPRAQFESQVTQPIASAPASAPSSGFGAGTSFGQPATTSNPFAKPAAAAFGQNPSSSNPFAKPTASSTFGAQSRLGQPAFGSTGFSQTPAFGQPSQPAATFGQPTAPTTSSGQPLGTTAFGASGFGQTAPKNPFAAPSAAGGFRQATAFEQTAQTGSAFGQPPQNSLALAPSSQTAPAFGQPPPPSSTFGQASVGQATAFGKPAFGQAGQPATGFGQTPNTRVATFGQAAETRPNPFGQAVESKSNPFAQSSQTSVSPFGQTSTSSTTTFGQPSTNSIFGQKSLVTNPFAQQPKPTNGSNSFAPPLANAPGNLALGQSSGSQPWAAQPTTSSVQTLSTAGSQLPIETTELTNLIAELSAGGPNPLTGNPTAAVHVTQRLNNVAPSFATENKLLTFRGQQVQYHGTTPCIRRYDGRAVEKVWFPKGPAGAEVMTTNQPGKLWDFQSEDSEYGDEVKEQYRVLFESGRFEAGKMPLIPPRREWCVFDF